MPGNRREEGEMPFWAEIASWCARREVFSDYAFSINPDRWALIPIGGLYGWGVPEGNPDSGSAFCGT